MDLLLKNKVIVITGGASGIGESITKKLTDEDGIPCIIDYNEQSLSKISDELTGRDIKFISVYADLTDEDSCRNAVTKIIDKYGRIDGLVNNAGLNDGVGLEHGNAHDFIKSLERNVTHYYLMAQLVYEQLKISKGSIVNICSKVAVTGQGGTSGYAAANGIRLELTQNWAAELLPFGIRVNAVVVAECLTPQYEWWLSQQADYSTALKQISDKIPLEKRLTMPGEIADTALFLLSSKSDSINGEFFFVDGGYTHLDRKV